MPNRGHFNLPKSSDCNAVALTQSLEVSSLHLKAGTCGVAACAAVLGRQHNAMGARSATLLDLPADGAQDHTCPIWIISARGAEADF